MGLAVLKNRNMRYETSGIQRDRVSERIGHLIELSPAR